MSSSQTPQRFKSVTEAATVLALGGQFIRQNIEDRVLVFYIVPPTNLDLNDPGLSVPVAPMLGWVETLASRVRAHNRHQQQRGGTR